jgi:hypothetical protein
MLGIDLGPRRVVVVVVVVVAAAGRVTTAATAAGRFWPGMAFACLDLSIYQE